MGPTLCCGWEEQSALTGKGQGWRHISDAGIDWHRNSFASADMRVVWKQVFRPFLNSNSDGLDDWVYINTAKCSDLDNNVHRFVKTHF